jgi:hypothetical protein
VKRLPPLALLPLLSLAAHPAAAVDLQGTWHVLVHYKDSAASNPDAERWEDRVWVFEREGEGLRWIDYPIVVLSDESNRFDRLGTNKASRKLVYWTPSPAQQAELAEGPKVNSRGSKSKILKGSDESWASTGSQPRSLAYVTYEEHWSIADAKGKPVFLRTDILGGGAAAESEGATRFATSEVEAGDRVLRGSYDRDGTRQGSFVLTRVGPIRNLTSSEDREKARLREHWMDQLGKELGGEEEAP